MRFRSSLVSVGLGTALALGVMTAPAQATPTGCSSWKTGPNFAYGVCNDVSRGGWWRLGIRCSDGDYRWSDEKRTTQRTSLRCLASGTVITHHWIDTF
ncbi:hypothetical protein [Streptomyces sp. F001]|uniref:hypothetical protein n=1 Tax=Streptomyces sp. F001 TaxID=1510026 RepID=UPI00101E823E|nr:hypothetical protein [Streptomyces sp. F001]